MIKDYNISRREFLKISLKNLAMTSAGLSLPFSFFTGCKTQQEELRLGYIPITDASPLLIAYDLGYFSDEGIVARPPVLIRSWSLLVEAFLAGKVNVTHLLIPIPIWMRYSKNIPVKIIAWDHTNGSALTVGAESTIKNFADLGGKQIAVPYWYSMHNIILQLGLRRSGLKAVIKSRSETLKKDEVNLFILPPPGMPPALAAKKLDGYIVAEPFNALGEEKIKAKIMRFTGDIWKNHPCCTVVTSERLIQSDPVFIQKVTNAIVRAQYWLLNNRKEAAKILSNKNKGYLPVSTKVLERVFLGYELSKYGIGNTPHAIQHPGWKIQRIGFQPYPFPSATRFIFDTLKHTLVEGNTDFMQKVETDFIVNDLVDDRFVKNAVMNLGGPEKFPDMDLEAPWIREEIVEL